MITDLGLHQSVMPARQTGAEDSTSESVLLHRLLCACISYEGIWCFYLGRPSSIPRSVLDAAFVRCNNDRGQEATIMAAWVGLCIPMGEICEVLNCSGSLDSKSTSRLLELDTELQKWQDSLPPSIAYNERRLMDLDPVAFGMHMQCCKVQILVYQALKNAVGLAGQRQQLIHDKALRMIRLLLTYRQIHGVEKVPSIMLDSANLALTTIISHCQDPLNSGVSLERDMQWLHMSIDTLRSVRSHFPITQRMLHTLEKIADGPQFAGLFTAATSPESPPKKQPAYRTNGKSPGSVRETHFLSGIDGEERNGSPFGAVNRFAHGDHFLGQQPPALDCEWLPHDPGEASAALLSFPDLQLASLWLPTTSSGIEGESL